MVQLALIERFDQNIKVQKLATPSDPYFQIYFIRFYSPLYNADILLYGATLRTIRGWLPHDDKQEGPEVQTEGTNDHKTQTW